MDEFEYKGFKYRIVSVVDATVELIYAGELTGKIVVPEEVEYQNQQCKVVAIRGAEKTEYSDYVYQPDKRYKKRIRTTSKDVIVPVFVGKRLQSFQDKLEVVLPKSLKEIGDYAFYDCYNLVSVNIPVGVTSIGGEAFKGCSSLTSVTIPNSVTSIGSFAFRGCSSLTSVTIPNSVTSIGVGAFYGCSKLTAITIPESVTSIGDEAFSSCSSLTSLTIPNSVTSIGKFAFYCCSSLTSITIPNSVTSIESYTFGACTSLTEIAIPNTITDIGEKAFLNCIRLGKVTLGSSIKNIAANAFAECTRLYDVYCYATYPPFVDDSAFANYNVYLYVPCESQRDYMLDIVWGKFKFVECIDSEDVTTDGIVVTPSTNDVTIIWPTETGADTYTIVIKKGDEVFCTLTFNADGQLLNIAFAPGREGNHPAQYAEAAANGYRFTITGLNESTKYAYNLYVKDSTDKTIKSYEGVFTTQSTTAVDEIQSTTNNVEKIFLDGQLLIIRDGKTYNAQGAAL